MASSVVLATRSTVAPSSNTESPSVEQFDTALAKIWTRIRLASEEFRPVGAKLSEVMQLPNPTAELIRKWFRNEEPEVCDISQLDCKELGLDVLPPEICELDELEFLGLEDNNLQKLPSAIVKLSNLVWLHLHRNKLTSLPPELGQLKWLRALNAPHNQLTRIPSELNQLRKLKVLDLSNNLLTGRFIIDDNWKRLETLSLSNNRITGVIGCKKDKLEKLKTLDLDGNPLLFRLNTDLSKSSDGNNLVPWAAKARYEACANHLCRTPLAALCQAIHCGQNPEILREQFEKLSKELQGKILKHISVDPSQPSGDYLADEAAFVKALIIELEWQFQDLTMPEKQRVYKQAALFPEKNASNLLDKTLAEENVIHLIDAMEMVKK